MLQCFFVNWDNFLHNFDYASQIWDDPINKKANL